MVQDDLFVRYVSSELGVKVLREYRFYRKRRWRFDYAIPDYRIAVEVEGGVWTQGRHTRGKGFIADMDKYNIATLMGWRLFRFTPQSLMSEKSVKMLKIAIKTQ